MIEIEALAGELKIEADRIRAWIAQGLLEEQEGKVARREVVALVRAEALEKRLREADATIGRLETGIKALPDSFQKTTPGHHFWLSLVASLLAVGVAGWGVHVANRQLGAALESLKAQTTAFQSQTTAFQAQTAYQVQSDILSLYERISAPFLSVAQIRAMLKIYDQRIRIAKDLARPEIGALDGDFWEKYSTEICETWTKSYCEGDVSFYPETIEVRYPGIVELCYAETKEKDQCGPG